MQVGKAGPPVSAIWVAVIPELATIEPVTESTPFEKVNPVGKADPPPELAQPVQAKVMAGIVKVKLTVVPLITRGTVIGVAGKATVCAGAGAGGMMIPPKSRNNMLRIFILLDRPAFHDKLASDLGSNPG